MVSRNEPRVVFHGCPCSPQHGLLPFADAGFKIKMPGVSLNTPPAWRENRGSLKTERGDFFQEKLDVLIVVSYNCWVAKLNALEAGNEGVRDSFFSKNIKAF